MDATSPALARTAAHAASSAVAPPDTQLARVDLAALPRVGVLRNPRSHRNKRLAPDHAGLAEVLVAEPRDRGPELAAALARFAAAGVGILAIDGGDGTVRDVLTQGASVFGASWPLLVVLPKGKTNALAVDLGVPRLWTLGEALAAARSGNLVLRRPLVVDRQADGRDGRGRHPLWGFVLGAGTFIAATEAGQKAHRRGAFQSFAVLVTLVGALANGLFGAGESVWRRVWPMRLASLPDGAELPHSGAGSRDGRYLALFSTLRRLPLGIRLFRPNDRAIRYFLIDAPRRRALARIPMVLCGSDAPSDAAIGIHRGAGDEFAIELDGDGFILDGEAFPPARLRLRQGPVLRFIVP